MSGDKMPLAGKYYAGGDPATAFIHGSDQTQGRGVAGEAGKGAKCNRIHPT